MGHETIKELEAARSKVTELEAALAKGRETLSSLPSQFGFSSVDEFLAAVRYAVSRSTRHRASNATSIGGAATGTRGSKRAKITPEIKQQLKAMVGQGKTGAAIAKALGISLPSVGNIKKELGLTNPRKK